MSFEMDKSLPYYSQKDAMPCHYQTVYENPTISSSSSSISSLSTSNEAYAQEEEAYSLAKYTPPPLCVDKPIQQELLSPLPSSFESHPTDPPASPIPFSPASMHSFIKDLPTSSPTPSDGMMYWKPDQARSYQDWQTMYTKPSQPPCNCVPMIHYPTTLYDQFHATLPAEDLHGMPLQDPEINRRYDARSMYPYGPMVLSTSSSSSSVEEPLGQSSRTRHPPLRCPLGKQDPSPCTSPTPRRYKCTLCVKRFTRPSSLATHMHSHTGEKPYQCQEEGCGRRFSVVSNLRRHSKIHRKSQHRKSS